MQNGVSAEREGAGGATFLELWLLRPSLESLRVVDECADLLLGPAYEPNFRTGACRKTASAGFVLSLVSGGRWGPRNVSPRIRGHRRDVPLF